MAWFSQYRFEMQRKITEQVCILTRSHIVFNYHVITPYFECWNNTYIPSWLNMSLTKMIVAMESMYCSVVFY